METILEKSNSHKFDYNGQAITFLSGNDVMVNATQMAKAFGKRPADWMRLPSTTSFMDALSEVRKSHSGDNQLIKTSSGGVSGGGGTWMHEDVALEFARWLSPQFAIWCNSHIKTLLKHGLTATDNTIKHFLSNPDLAIQAFTALKQERERSRSLENQVNKKEGQIQVLQSEIEIATPKVEYYNKVLSSDGLLTTTQIAKNYGWTAQKLNKLLHTLGIQYKQSGQWQLYSEYHDCNYSKSVPYLYQKEEGEVRTLHEMKWTQQGKEFIHNILLSNGYIQDNQTA